MLARVLFTVLLSTTGLYPSLSRAEDAPYYVVNQTFALGTEPYNGKYVRVAFLPRRYLLYLENGRQPAPVLGGKFLRAKTQDSVEVYVLASDVSRRPFRTSIGSHEIVFNSSGLLCKHEACDKADDQQVWHIRPGDAFEIDGDADAPFLTLEGGDEIVGYIGAAELSTLIARGEITRTDYDHPRYEVTKNVVVEFGTECSNKIAGRVNVQAPEAIVEVVLRGFPVGSLNNGVLVIPENVRYGGENQKIEVRLYKLVDRWEDESELPFYVVGIFTFRCIVDNFGLTTLEYIERLLLWNSRTERRESWDIESLGAPKNLVRYTEAPYLVSVNNGRHHETLIRLFSELLGDRVLAGYLLSEVNRSCSGSYRQESACQDFRYEIPRPRPR